MFSGIVEQCGSIVELDRQLQVIRALIACDYTDLVPGESIAVDGICLTVTKPTPKHFYCDISPSTFDLTTAKTFKIGQKVNLERALKIGDRLGGHWISGHVEQRGTVQTMERKDEVIVMRITGITKEESAYLVKRGSIAINGISLTVNAIFDGGFEVLLIPFTLDRTNLGTLAVGSHVNLEFDYLAKIVCSQLKQLEFSK